MGETADEIYRRAKAAVGADGRLAMPPVSDWETFPFGGELRVRELQAPVAQERPRWGEGGEHLHVWFMARPARMQQLIGSFAAIWDDILPPTPEDVWRANLAAVADALA